MHVLHYFWFCITNVYFFRHLYPYLLLIGTNLFNFLINTQFTLMSCFHFDLPLSIAHLHLARCRVKCGYKFDYKTACCQLKLWKIKTINKEYIMKKNGTSLSGNPLSKPSGVTSHSPVQKLNMVYANNSVDFRLELN